MSLFFAKLVRLIETLSAYVVLSLLVLLVVLDVILTFFFKLPIFWAEDAKKLLLLLVLTLGMLSTSYFQEHIRVSLLVDFLPSRFKLWIGKCVSVLNALILSMMTYSCFNLSLEMFQYQDRAEKIAIYFWPFALAITVITLLSAIIEIYRLFNPLTAE